MYIIPPYLFLFPYPDFSCYFPSLFYCRGDQGWNLPTDNLKRGKIPPAAQKEGKKKSKQGQEKKIG